MNKLLLSGVTLLLLGAAPADAADPVKIGVIYALTGPFAVAGQDCKRGTELAADEINAAGGIKSLGGAKIELVFGDTQSKPINAVSEAERLITQEKVVMLTGATTSSETIPMTQVSEKYGIPQINTLAQSADITGRGFKWIWSTTLIDADYAAGLYQALDMIHQLDPKLSTVGLINPDSEYGLEMQKLLTEGLVKRTDFKLVGNVQTSTKAQDDIQPVLKLKAAAPDVVLNVGYFRDGVLVAKALDQLDFHPVLVGTGGASSDPKLVEQIDKLVNGQFATTPFSADRPNVKPVADAYQKKFDQPLTLNSALPYQAMLVVARALEAAASTEPQAIAKALREIKLEGSDIIVASDYIQFDENGRNKGRATVNTQFQDGKIVTVYPPAKATGKPVLAHFGE
jgi:branched-chain amino acid transport system substrate-binding protein